MKKSTCFIQWQDAYSVGNAVIDRQHRFVINLINELYDGLRDGKDSLEISPFLEKLDKYVRAHFAYEEKYLEDNEYPNKDQHFELHKEMKIKALEFSWSGRHPEMEPAAEIFDFLKRWWLNHILKEDMAYARYFRGK